MLAVSDAITDQGITEEAVTTILSDVLSTMTGSSALGPVPLPVDTAAPLTAAVYFVGAWKGAVFLQCPPALCFLLTARMLGVPQPESVGEDVRDTMGELCNMVAGNLKSVMLNRAELSLPSIVQGTDYSLSVCGQATVARWCYHVDGLPCVVSVIQMDTQS